MQYLEEAQVPRFHLEHIAPDTSAKMPLAWYPAEKSLTNTISIRKDFGKIVI